MSLCQTSAQHLAYRRSRWTISGHRWSPMPATTVCVRSPPGSPGPGGNVGGAAAARKKKPAGAAGPEAKIRKPKKERPKLTLELLEVGAGGGGERVEG